MSKISRGDGAGTPPDEIAGYEFIACAAGRKLADAFSSLHPRILSRADKRLNDSAVDFNEQLKTAIERSIVITNIKHLLGRPLSSYDISRSLPVRIINAASRCSEMSM